jgi:polysaccharide deacetylase 2 family uncharacterized protein YibQ
MVIKTRGKKKNNVPIVIVLVFLVIIIIISRPLIKKKTEKPPQKPQAEKTVPTPEEKQKPSSEKKTPPRHIAIIIDDVGYPVDTVKQYAAFRGKLTFSVIPFLAYSKKYADLLYRSGFEIMLHVPMEPLDYPVDDPGFGAIFVGDTKPVVQKKMRRMLDNIPNIHGANNHMGSRATQDFELMVWTLSTLAERNMFFIDSLTTPDSRAYEAAKTLGMASGRRDVFLDNTDDYTAINTQFEKLKNIALSRGTAIGIGHIQSKNLITVLNDQFALLKRDNITLVFVSEAVGRN